MKKLHLIVAFILVNATGYSQNQEEIIQILIQKSASIQCISCRFTQYKKMAMLVEPSIAEGFIIYNSPDKIHWEYISPYSFALVVEGDKITKITDGHKSVLDSKSQRMYQGIVDMIMSCATGKKLFDQSVFNIDIHDVEGYWEAKMYPKKNNMKRMFTMLTVCFSKVDSIINKVEITEANGDITTIQFLDVKINDLCK